MGYTSSFIDEDTEKITINFFKSMIKLKNYIFTIYNSIDLQNIQPNLWFYSDQPQ